jgi:hypothetical protein
MGLAGAVMYNLTTSKVIAQVLVVVKVQFTGMLFTGLDAIAHSAHTDLGMALGCPEAPYEL